MELTLSLAWLSTDTTLLLGFLSSVKKYDTGVKVAEKDPGKIVTDKSKVEVETVRKIRAKL